MPYCIAFGCNNSTDKICPGISFHRLPKDPKRLRQWLSSLKLVDPPTRDENARVCSAHFESSCFENLLQQKLLGIEMPRRLRGDVVPTIFTFTLPVKRRAASEKRAADKQLNSLLELVDPAEPTDREVTVGGTCSVGTQTGRWNIYGYQLCLLTS